MPKWLYIVQPITGVWNAYYLIAYLYEGRYGFALVSGLVVLITASWRLPPRAPRKRP